MAGGLLIRSQIPFVDPLDPVVYAAGSVIVLITALVGGAVPARRASTIDPILTLRND